MTIKKLKSIDIINVLSDLVSEKMKTTVKLPFIGYGPSKDPQVVVAVLEERLKGGNDAPSIAKKAFSLYFEKYGYNN